MCVCVCECLILLPLPYLPKTGITGLATTPGSESRLAVSKHSFNSITCPVEQLRDEEGCLSKKVIHPRGVPAGFESGLSTEEKVSGWEAGRQVWDACYNSSA